MADIAEQEEYRARLNERLKILQKNLETGKIHVAEHLRDSVKESLCNIKYDGKGEIILESVDASIRSMALLVEQLDVRDELKKKYSLFEIQSLYFDFISTNFDHFYQQMLKANVTPGHIAEFLSSKSSFVNSLIKQLPDFLEAIYEFWRNVGDIAYWHIEDSHEQITGVYGGDLFPTHDENIASKCGIYSDTIVLPDPFVRSKIVFEHYPDDKKVYYLIKHAMNILKYRNLACVENGKPIVVILPDMPNLEDNGRDFLNHVANLDALIHAEKIFGRKFESIDEFTEFCLSLDTVENTIKEIKDPNRVLFDSDWKEPLPQQFKRALGSDEMKAIGRGEPGLLLFNQALGRMSVSNELLLKARQLSGTPIMDVETSWRFLNWKLEYDASKAKDYYHSEDLHILKGLTDLSQTDLPWLGNIPPESLLELRRQGALEEIRSILGNNIQELVHANPTNCFRTRDQILENVEQSFENHRKKLEELKAKNWKFAGHDIGSWIVMGGIEISAALTGTPAWGVAALIANQFLDAPKLKEIPQRYQDLVKQNKEVHQSPVGMLFKISKS